MSIRCVLAIGVIGGLLATAVEAANPFGSSPTSGSVKIPIDIASPAADASPASLQDAAVRVVQRARELVWTELAGDVPEWQRRLEIRRTAGFVMRDSGLTGAKIAVAVERESAVL